MVEATGRPLHRFARSRDEGLSAHCRNCLSASMYPSGAVAVVGMDACPSPWRRWSAAGAPMPAVTVEQAVVSISLWQWAVLQASAAFLAMAIGWAWIQSSHQDPLTGILLLFSR